MLSFIIPRIYTVINFIFWLYIFPYFLSVFWSSAKETLFTTKDNITGELKHDLSNSTSIKVHNLTSYLNFENTPIIKYIDYVFTLTKFSHTNISPTYLIMIAGIVIFFIGLTGIIICFRNIIVIFMSIEMMLFGFLIMILSLSVQYNDFIGVLLGLCILAIAGSESAIGLAMLVNFYTVNKDVSIKVLSNLRF